jgi:hypothetical protein
MREEGDTGEITLLLLPLAGAVTLRTTCNDLRACAPGRVSQIE